MTGFVYFIKPIGMPGPVKIGFSKQSESRLAVLLVSSPLALEIIAKVEGTTMLERTLHACFADSHSHCEWFRPSERLTTTIAAIRSGVPIDKAVDLKKAFGVIKVEYAPKTPERQEFLSVRRRVSRAYAELNRLRGSAPHMRMPDDAALILAEWQRQLRFAAWRPDNASVTRLHEVASDPFSHGLTIILRPTPSEARAA